MALDYFYGSQAEQFVFYRIPKVLFTDKKYSDISLEAKVLYGLMLDRVGLSRENGWIDEQGRVFIIYSIEEIMKAMNCGNKKVSIYLNELETACGLIERKRRGLGLPNIIYVKNFIDSSPSQKIEDEPLSEDESNIIALAEMDTSRNVQADTSRCVQMDTSRNVQADTSGHVEMTRQEVSVRHANNTEFSDTERSNTEKNNNINISPIASLPNTPPVREATGRERQTKETLSREEREACRRMLIERLRPGELKQDRPEAARTIDSFFELVYETVCTTKAAVRIGGENLPAEVVRNRFLSLTGKDLERAAEAWQANTTQVRNPRQYMLAMLYNAPIWQNSRVDQGGGEQERIDLDELDRLYEQI